MPLIFWQSSFEKKNIIRNNLQFSWKAISLGLFFLISPFVNALEDQIFILMHLFSADLYWPDKRDVILRDWLKIIYI